jgi:hypothetical protein
LKRKIVFLNDNDTTGLQTKSLIDELIIGDGQIASSFLFTYLLQHIDATNRQLIAINATRSEYNVFKMNQQLFSNTNDQSVNKLEEPTFRTNYIYLINNIKNGKNYLVCQLFDQLKVNEVYDWINQVIFNKNWK